MSCYRSYPSVNTAPRVASNKEASLVTIGLIHLIDVLSGLMLLQIHVFGSTGERLNA